MDELRISTGGNGRAEKYLLKGTTCGGRKGAVSKTVCIQGTTHNLVEEGTRDACMSWCVCVCLRVRVCCKGQEAVGRHGLIQLGEVSIAKLKHLDLFLQAMKSHGTFLSKRATWQAGRGSTWILYVPNITHYKVSLVLVRCYLAKTAVLPFFPLPAGPQSHFPGASTPAMTVPIPLTLEPALPRNIELEQERTLKTTSHHCQQPVNKNSS